MNTGKVFRTIPLHIAPGPDDRAVLETKRAELVAALARPLAPGEVRAPYLARVAAGPVPGINLKASGSAE